MVGAIVAFIASTNGFAIEITKGKLLEHREWSTSAVKSATHTQINPLSPFNITKFNDSLKNSGHKDIFASNCVWMKVGIYDIWNDAIEKTTTITASDELNIQNSSNKPEIYNIKTLVCAENVEAGVIDCNGTSDSIMLDADGNMHSYLRHRIKLLPLDPGSYNAVSEISIQKEGDATSYKTSDHLLFTIDSPAKK